MEKTKICTMIVLMLMCFSLMTIVPTVSADTVVNVWVAGENVEININGDSLDWIADSISSLKSSVSKVKSSIRALKKSLHATDVQVSIIKNDLGIVIEYLSETMNVLNATVKTVQQHSLAINYLLENKLQFENYTIAELERLDATMTLYNEELTSLMGEMASDFAELVDVVNELGSFVYDELLVEMERMGNEDVAINANLSTLWRSIAILALAVFSLAAVGVYVFVNKKVAKSSG